MMCDNCNGKAIIGEDDSELKMDLIIPEGAISYIELLKKYIQYVGDCEGTNFISSCDRFSTDGKHFNKEEIYLLKDIAMELENNE